METRSLSRLSQLAATGRNGYEALNAAAFARDPFEGGR
jgi:hypothetical protein